MRNESLKCLVGEGIHIGPKICLRLTFKKVKKIYNLPQIPSMLTDIIFNLITALASGKGRAEDVINNPLII